MNSLRSQTSSNNCDFQSFLLLIIHCAGERDGINTSYMQMQELLREERERGVQLERKLLEEQNVNRKLDSEKIEVNLDY